MQLANVIMHVRQTRATRCIIDIHDESSSYSTQQRMPW